MRSWSHELYRLYATHKGLKVELESLFNFLLGPTEFERAWSDTVDKYGIKEHPAIKSLWNKKKMWIMTYFKGLSSGRMTSTQMSERWICEPANVTTSVRGDDVGSATTYGSY
jgi:hypothetical protein